MWARNHILCWIMKRTTAKDQQRKRGRPKADAARAVTRRHVLNITPEMEAAVERFARDNGISRLTDALRQLLVKSLRAEGLL